MRRAEIILIRAGCFCLLLSWAASPTRAAVVTVENKSGQTVTLSDFISYANDNNTGASVVHIKKKDASDDIGLAVGGTKNIDVGADKSWTVSWLNSAGKEVETDTKDRSFEIKKAQLLAMFDSNFPGFYDIAADLDAFAALPTIGTTYVINASGHPTGLGLDWLTFFDVTSSSTGFIERDALGNPISPLLPAGTEVTASFLWAVTAAVPEPPMLGLLAACLAVLMGLRSRLPPA
jgi:hypothetical protein